MKVKNRRAYSKPHILKSSVLDVVIGRYVYSQFLAGCTGGHLFANGKDKLRPVRLYGNHHSYLESEAEAITHSSPFSNLFASW